MATPQQLPPSRPPTQQPSTATIPKIETPGFVHYGAMVAVVLGPLALFTPPRKMGLQALLLASGTFYASNILAYDYTGQSMYQRFVRRWNNMVDGGLPEKARHTQELMRLERERREGALPEAERRRLQEDRERKEMAARGPLQRLWMGNEKENWREERARKDKEALEEGKGYGDLIVEQVKEVFGSEKKDGQDGNNEKSDDNNKKQ